MADRLMGSAAVVEAAGGVLWRAALGGSGVEIALVHRPKYDDWSIPKGKLEPREPPVLGALREIREETGHRAVPGRPLGEKRYLKDGRPKRVRYWSMRDAGGGFSPTDEVDQLVWLPPREAQHFLAPDRDRDIATEYARDIDLTWAVLLVRHGSAGERAAWSGADRDRPLDDLGREQADMLARVFSAYDIHRALSADVLRCLDTVGPYAAQENIAVESEPLLSEAGQAAHPTAAAERLLNLVDARESVVVCSQGRAMPDLVVAMCMAYDVEPPRDPSVRKGGGWIMHFAANGKPRLSAHERFDPPA
jgi:8-oxo-dGTP pyrophosphatase MutT (NUDIX family)/phosphohistidine phosphatase SixA